MATTSNPGKAAKAVVKPATAKKSTAMPAVKTKPVPVEKSVAKAVSAQKTATAVKPVAQAKTKVPAKPKQPAASAKVAVAPKAKPAKTVSNVDKATTQVKAKKVKLVRDSYTIPESEHKQLAALKARCLGHGKAMKKGELLRAGIQALVLMGDADFLAAVDSVEVIKTGRPAGDK